MSRPYERVFRAQAAPGGAAAILTLNFPSRCLLTKLAIKQVAGVAATFTVSIYNSLDGATNALPGNLIATASIPSDAAGTLVRFFAGAEGVYENQDSTSPTNKSYAIYLVLTPAGSDAADAFDITLACLLGR